MTNADGFGLARFLESLAKEPDCSVIGDGLGCPKEDSK